MYRKLLLQIALLLFCGVAHAAPVGLFGFEEGSLGTAACCAGCTGSSGTISVQSTTVRSGGFALRANPTTTATGLVRLMPLDARGMFHPNATFGATTYTRFYFRLGTLPATNSEPFIRFSDNGTNPKFTYYVNSSGNILAYNSSGTLVETSIGTITTGVWYKIDIETRSGAGSTAYKLEVDDVTFLSGSAAQAAANVGILFVGKVINANSQTVDFYYDDMLVDNAAKPLPGAVVRLIPNAAGDTNNWTAGTAPSDYTQCLEVPTDSNTSYVKKSATSSQSFNFNFQSTADVGIPSDAIINGMKTWSYVVATSATATADAPVLTCGGSTNTTTTVNFGADPNVYYCRSIVNSTCAGTSLAYTASDIDSLLLGHTDTSASADVRVSTTYLMVDYVTPTPTPTPTPVGGKSDLLLLGIGK